MSIRRESPFSQSTFKTDIVEINMFSPSMQHLVSFSVFDVLNLLFDRLWISNHQSHSDIIILIINESMAL